MEGQTVLREYSAHDLEEAWKVQAGGILLRLAQLREFEAEIDPETLDKGVVRGGCARGIDP